MKTIEVVRHLVFVLLFCLNQIVWAHNKEISIEEAIKRNLQGYNENKKVIGCGNGIEVGGRPIGWVHINAAGDAFLCCNDYDFDFKFGNFKTQELRDFWGTEEHINLVQKSYDTICRNCASAIFE